MKIKNISKKCLFKVPNYDLKTTISYLNPYRILMLIKVFNITKLYFLKTVSDVEKYLENLITKYYFKKVSDENVYIKLIDSYFLVRKNADEMEISFVMCYSKSDNIFKLAENFDYNKAISILSTLRWTYYNTNGIEESVDKLKKDNLNNLIELYEKGIDSISSGGFLKYNLAHKVWHSQPLQHL